ncbi:hypothetical protein F4775DRAFT_522111 [Biscogniauxia sp. FL1348]|nr:hypothetical protein F4775DRAFT_522111 [Biscogniauxia sp. FL1348]
MEELESTMSSGLGYPPSYHTSSNIPSTRDQTNDWMSVSNQNYGSNEDKSACTSSSRYGETPSCKFLHDGPDKCYKARFWARALEFYFLEQRNPLPNNTYPCLMLNCAYKDFKSPREMLLHLKQCEHFPEGQYLCPACNSTSSFRTSGRRCSWNRVSFGSKIRKTLKSPMALFKDMMRRNSAPTPSIPSLEVDQQGIEEFNPLEISELENSQLIHELNAERSRAYSWIPSPKPEWTKITPVELEDLQQRASRFNVPKLDASECLSYPSHTLHMDFSQVLGSQISPSQPSSTSSKSHEECLSDIPPTSGSTTAQSTPTGILDYGIIDLATHQRLISDQSIQQEIGHIESQYPDLWPSPSPLQPSATLSEYNTELGSFMINDPSNVLPTAFISQAEFQNAKVPPLSIETGNMVPDFHIPVYDRESFKCDTGAWDYVKRINDSFQQPPLGMATQVYHNVVFPFSDMAEEEVGSDARDSSEASYSPHSKPADSSSFSSSSSPVADIHGSPNTESPTRDAAQLKCEHCSFVPTGKEKYLKAYLRKHLKTHEDLTPLPCSCCEKLFTRQDNLTHHIQVFHPDFQISPNPPCRKRKRSSASVEIVLSKRRRSSAM